MDTIDSAQAPESPVLGDTGRAVLTRNTSYANRHHIKPHWHARAHN